MTVSNKVNVVDGEAVRRYAASVLTHFNNHALLPEKDGDYGITIVSNPKLNSTECTIEESGKILKIHSVSLDEFDDMALPMRSFDHMYVKLTRDSMEVPPLEVTSTTLQFNGSTIRVMS